MTQADYSEAGAPLWTMLGEIRRGWAPPTTLKVSEFADREIIVTTGPLAGTHWRTDFAPYQRGILDAFHEPGVEIVAVMGSSQWGKALALDTPIATPDGWSTIGDLVVGDRVFDEAGRPCRVTFVTPVTADHRCYRLSFSDKTSIVADADHRWYVESDISLRPGDSWRGPGPRTGVLTTDEIAATWQWHAGQGQRRRARHRYAIPIARPLQCRSKSLLIHPYVLGVWLGDGKSSGGAFYTDDHEVAAAVELCGQRVTPNAARYAHGLPGLLGKLRTIGVLNNKHIPAVYLRASEEQRRDLLAGLMDTDGSVEVRNSRCEFSTTVEALADGIVELMRSLGLKPTVKVIQPRCQYKGQMSQGAQAWRIRFVAYEESQVFRLSRKRERLQSREGRRTTETERRRIVGVDPVPSVPVKCITVDSPNHLYLAGRAMIPTHNTSIAVNVVAYHMAHDPCPILVVEPTVDPMAKDFSKNRLEPVIAASPILREAVSKKRAKDSSNTTLQKTFRGGFLAIGGANSAASLAARSTRLLVLDEVDRYPPELPGEGSTLAIAFKRTTAYRRRRRILLLSSPTLRGASIDTWFQRGDQRRYYVPCPDCGEMQPYTWAQVKWQGDDPATARIICRACEHGLDDAERVAVLAQGEWRSERLERVNTRVVSFHMWEAYSPLASLAEIVSGFLQARACQKAGDKAEMHTWQNTTLGEPIEPDAGEGAEPHVLLMRREEYGSGVDVPAGGCVLTMGVDVQDDRLELLVLAWGPGEEAWFVDRHALPGDTSQPEPWKMLDEVLEHQYRHESGQLLTVQGTCIDSGGHRTTLVYDYAARLAARRVYAIIGRDGQRPIVSSPSPRRWGRQQRQVPLYTVGVDAAKALLISRLMLTEKGAGYVHVPHIEWADEEFAAQLTSERLVMRWHKGIPEQVWKQIRPRNEMLDCAIYALAALRLLHPDLEQLAARLNGTKEPKSIQPVPPKQHWLGPRRESWLKGRR